MDMNAFRTYLSQRAEEQGTVNKPQHRAFGSALDSVNSASIESHTEIDFEDLDSDVEETTVESVNERTIGNELDRRRGVKDMAASRKAAEAKKPKKSKSGDTVYSTNPKGLTDSTDDESLTGRDIVEAFEIVNMFCESIMEEHGLNEESEDIDAIIEEALNLLDLDEDYGKMPTVSQSLSDKDKLKVQKGEKSQMPKAGVEDKLPGEQQSNIDAIKAVLGGKKGSAAGSAY